MKLFTEAFICVSFLCLSAVSIPLDFSDLPGVANRRPDRDLVGYLGTFFLGSEPNVYFYLSDGNDATSFKALNGGSPVLVPTEGTGGVRDPAIVRGGGKEAGKKWYIIGTDLDIGKTTWSAAVRTGSLGIFVWESTDLVTWRGERLVKVEDDTAGMVWAPEAMWDETAGKYLVYWASKFYNTSDTNHTGTPSLIKIRSAHTPDFKTFTAPVDYVSYTFDVIDLTILPLGGNSYTRFIKNEITKQVFQEISNTGIHGTWTRPGSPDSIVESNVEGPAAYWDNLVKGKAHLLLDFFNSDGYHPYKSSDVEGGNWTASNRTNFPVKLRHGSVLPVDRGRYNALNETYG